MEYNVLLFDEVIFCETGWETALTAQVLNAFIQTLGAVQLGFEWRMPQFVTTTSSI